MYLIAPTGTTITNISNPEKLIGTTANVISPSGFTSSGNRLTYTGTTTPQIFSVVCSISLSGNKSAIYNFYIAKNGAKQTGSDVKRYINSTSDIGALSVSSMVSLSTGEYIEVWVQGDDTGTITIQTMNVLIHN